MRTIQRTISLEPMTSRLPGVLPAYKDNVLYFFDENSLKEREYEFPSNYGMIPVNIMLDNAPSAATDWNLSYTSHCYGQTLDTDEVCYEEPYYNEFGKFTTLSWYSLSEWYRFFTDYYHLLNDWGHCGTAYSSATHYYSAESKNGYAPQMRYGTDEQAYIDMDELFKARGGIVSSTTCTDTEYRCNFDKCSAHTIISESVDIGFFKWVCDNIVPSFTIPAQYKDYWRRDKLFYPDVITWAGWLEDRSDYGSLGSIWKCSGSTDCCECEKWFNLGGNDILGKMQEWYSNVQSKILTSINEPCAIPTIIEPVNMQVSIDDLGEFSIFSTDYELGVDYRTIPTENNVPPAETGSTLIHYESGNAHSGTVVTMDGSAMILVSGTGFVYNETYMEKYVSECNDCHYQGVFSTNCPRCGSKNISISGWTRYSADTEQVACSFEEYDNAYREKNSGYTIDEKDEKGEPKRTGYTQGDVFYYTFDDNDRRITSSGETGLRQQLAIRYRINKCDAVLIGNSLYDVQKEEYGEYDSGATYIGGNTFYVYREDYTDTPYTIINGKKIYADFYPFSGSCNQFYYFPFFKEKYVNSNESTCSASTFNPNIYKKFPRTRTTVSDYKEFITYGGTQHEVSGNVVTINGNDYIRISGGTCETPDGYFYITQDKVYQLFDGNLEVNSAYSVVNETEIKKEVDDDIQVYVGGIITGETISKLYDLRSNALLVDDIGNTIEALYNVGEKYNHQPPEGEKLEPIYQVGNVANVKRFNLTIEHQEDLVSGTPNYFVGDIITSMKFYYKNINGDEVSETSYDKCGLFYIDNAIDDDNPTFYKTESDAINVAKGLYPTKKCYKTTTGEECESCTQEGCVEETEEEYTERIRREHVNKVTSLKAIIKSTDTKNEITDVLFEDDISCDITYYIGATLVRKDETTPFELVTGNTFSSGICYTETVKFIEKDVQYYLKNVIKKQIPMTRNAISAHTISYPVTCYVMEQEKTRIESDFNNYYYCALAHFEMSMCTSTTDFELYNGTQTFPVFRQEYKMGTACIQNVDSDIYIDRGINAAFEKHIKLGEVTSMEALEQYTNGYFKIIEN